MGSFLSACAPRGQDGPELRICISGNLCEEGLESPALFTPWTQLHPGPNRDSKLKCPLLELLRR